jgi:hypothetical protein
MIYPVPPIFDWTRFGLLPLSFWSRTVQFFVEYLESIPNVSRVVPKHARSTTASIIDLQAYRERLSKRYGRPHPRFRPALAGRDG